MFVVGIPSVDDHYIGKIGGGTMWKEELWKDAGEASKVIE